MWSHQTENFVKNVSLELISAHFRRLKNKNKNTTVVINRSRRYHTQCCSRHHLRSHLHRLRRRRCRLLQAVDGNILWKRKKSFNKWQIPSLFETLRCRKNILVKDILKMCHRVNFFYKNTINADLNLYKSLQKKISMPCWTLPFFACCKKLVFLSISSSPCFLSPHRTTCIFFCSYLKTTL